jgi:DNA invertase Pin-like site-specific DNA recombinase
LRAKTAKTADGRHLIGYARVSTSDQDTAIQSTALKAAGCSVVRVEKASGKSREGRDELASILEFVRPGDTLVVHKLDRLGRNTRDVLNLVHELDERGACLRVLEPAIDTCGPMGRMVLTVLGMVAEMEFSFIKDRQRAGIEAAKAKGVYKGRPPTFDRARIIQLRKEGMGASDIAKVVGCKRGNVYKALKAGGFN